jgi:putative heme-binding domain-containing protein
LDTAGLVAALDSPSGWQRDMAHQMLLWKNDPAAVVGLERMIQQCSRPQARLHALCVLDGLDALSADVVVRSLSDPHPGVRRHAVRLSESLVGEHPEVGPALLALADDPDPHVSLQLAYSLGEWDDPRAGKVLGQLAIRYPDEPYIQAAVFSSATPHLAEIAREIVGSRDQLPLARQATWLAELLRLAAALGDDRALRSLLETVCHPTASGYAGWQFATVGDFLDDLSRRNSSLGDVLGRSPDANDGTSADVSQLFVAARQVAVSEEAAVADRNLALRLLGRGRNGYDEDVKLLARMLGPQLPVDLQLESIDCLRRIGASQVPELLLDGWAEHTPRVHAAAVDALLSREVWTLALLDRIADDEKLATSLGTTRRDLLLHHPSAPIRDRAKELFASRQVTDRIQRSLDKFRPVVDMAGDPVRGKALFTELTCGDCHKLGDVGNAIAADLTTLLDKSPAALLTAVIDPNRAVEDKYIQYSVVTADGLIYTGMLLEETGNHIQLADQAGKIHTLLRRDIDELVSSGRSQMAEGLEEKMTLQQAADLFAFIGQTKSVAKPFAGNSPRVVSPSADGSLRLDAATAEIYGPSLVFEPEYQNLGYWQSTGDRAEWSLRTEKKGDYEIWLTWACPEPLAGKPFRLQVGDQSLLGTVGATGAWSIYREKQFGTVRLDAGDRRLGIRSAEEIKTPLFDLRWVVLKPVAP